MLLRKHVQYMYALRKFVHVQKLLLLYKTCTHGVHKLLYICPHVHAIHDAYITDNMGTICVIKTAYKTSKTIIHDHFTPIIIRKHEQ